MSDFSDIIPNSGVESFPEDPLDIGHNGIYFPSGKEPNELSNTSTQWTYEKSTVRNYKCPKCEGEFNSWDQDKLSLTDDSETCPFCGLEKGQYNPDNE